MSHFKQRIALFKAQPFRWYFLSCLFATFGNGLIYITSTWLTLKINDSVQSVAMLMIFFWAPFVIFGPLAGVITDKYPRKTTLSIVTLLRSVIALLFGLLFFWNLSIWFVYLFNAIFGILVAITIPTTLALAPEIVSESNLLNANATIDLAYEMGNIIGMGSAGFIISIFSVQIAFLICGVCFLVSTAAIYHVKHTSNIQVSQKKENYFADFMEGIKYLSHKKILFAFYTIQLLLMTAFMTAPVLLGPFAKNILSANATQFGQIEAALSVGVVTGGIITPYLIHNFGLRKVILPELILISIMFLLFIHVHRIFNAEIIYFIIGFCLSVWPIILTSAQQNTSKEFQGRLQSNFTSLAGLGTIIMFLVITFASSFTAINKLYWFEVIFTGTAAYLAFLYCYQKEKNEK